MASPPRLHRADASQQGDARVAHHQATAPLLCPEVDADEQWDQKKSPKEYWPDKTDLRHSTYRPRELFFRIMGPVPSRKARIVQPRAGRPLPPPQPVP